MTFKNSALDAVHRSLGAKMAEFAGWEMPIAYPSGTLAEHAACRTACAMFDVSHLGTVRVEGAGALNRLQTTLTNDLGKVGVGHAQYTHLLNESDGSVEDDIIVWWLTDETFDVMPNASNTSRVIDAIGGTDTTETRVVLALQGPSARTTLATLSDSAAATPRFHVQRHDILGTTCTVAGTGYTGEDGVEIAAPRHIAEQLWNALTDAGAIPAGLGARDTLRLEAALPLHGHELGPGITPLQANLEWVVAWKKPAFRGRAALEAEKARGLSRRLYGISIEGRRPARDGTPVLVSGQHAGIVTSGNFSPTLEHCIALAFLERAVEVGSTVELDVRGSMLPGVVCKTPFVKK